ncbi:impB/mucB/samB family protein [Plectosphaerella plurivora]|uniref:ImpB/mucB/samB family protein n=1 Tax=Plectosphaerella plurivora TaxID=936078 RepID=A0A9P9A5F7_9PEZI|nr:impB/mucB/samB family protein [Plectosphaerella plurivora]
MQHLKKRPPRRKDDRIILHFDYDCFYASVLENRNPALKSLPLGVKQKSILATCNYVARARGVKKLMLISDAKKVCPDIVIIEGEDLTPFRDVSKTIWSFLRSHSWNDKVERLGLDEVFMDVTDIIGYNIFCINKASLAESFFQLSKKDPERGFGCDLRQLAGCVQGDTPDTSLLDNHNYVKLLLASHLAQYLRLKIEEDFGFTSACGISSNKTLSKLVGSKNKPRNQTTLLALEESDVMAFIDAYTIRKIPGIGSKATRSLEQKLLSSHTEIRSYDTESSLTVQAVRTHSDIYPESLENLLSGPGSEQGIGVRIWNLLHGVDHAEVKPAADVPSQISIEDTYRGLKGLPDIEAELKKLSASLIRRMRVDLVTEEKPAGEDPPSQRWMAHPKTLRLSIRAWPEDDQLSEWDFSRTSRSQPLPNFVFNMKETIEDLGDRLGSDVLFPMLKKFHPERDHKWNLQLINICVANMVPSGSEVGSGVGRDISVMFKKQDDVLRQWRADTAIIEGPAEEQLAGEADVETDVDMVGLDMDVSWEAGQDTDRCSLCGHYIPSFAVSAHARYHEMGD